MLYNKLPNKLKKDIDELNIIVILLKDEKKTPQEISEQFQISTRQIKILRFIIEKGTSQDLDDALSNKYYLSAIKSNIQERKKNSKPRKIRVLGKSKGEKINELY